MVVNLIQLFSKHTGLMTWCCGYSEHGLAASCRVCVSAVVVVVVGCVTGFSSTVSAEPYTLFTVRHTTRADWRPHPVRRADRQVFWQVGEQIFQEAPSLQGHDFPVLAGTLDDIQALRTHNLDLKVQVIGANSGYRLLCPKQCSQMTTHTRRDWHDDLYDGYHGQHQISVLSHRFAEEFPQLVRVLQFGTTTEGRNIEAVVVASATGGWEHRPAVMIGAGIHAREFATHELALDLIYQLVSGYGVDASITAWLDDLQVWVLPCINPDGREACDQVDSMWRKNTRDNNLNGYHYDPVDGVDLNRNFPLAWAADNIGSSSTMSAQTYHGPYPASEPETQAMMALLQQLRPSFYLAMHSWWGMVYTPYGNHAIELPHPPQLVPYGTLLAQSALDESGRPYQYFSDNQFPYSVNGDEADWAYGMAGVAVFGLEVGTTGFQPLYTTYLNQILPGVRPVLFQLLALAHSQASQVCGWITNPDQTPVPARIDVTEITSPNDEHWQPRSDGFYQVPLRSPGNYSFRFQSLNDPEVSLTTTLSVPAGRLVYDVILDVTPSTPTPPTVTPIATPELTPTVAEPTVTTTSTVKPIFDLNQDGVVDHKDLLIFLSGWHQAY